jgi:hypothetical protein
VAQEKGPDLKMEAACYSKTVVPTYKFTLCYNPEVVLGGLVVIVLATEPKVRGFRPGRG